MDIRKFFGKPATKSSTARTEGASRPANTSTGSKQAKKATRRTAADVVDVNDDDDDDDFVPVRRPSARARKAAPKIVVDDAPKRAPKSAASRKRSRREAEPVEVVGVDDVDDRIAPAAQNASLGTGAGNGSGFGGSDMPDAKQSKADGAEEPEKKKKRWIPRTDAPPNRGNKPIPKGAPNCLKDKVFVITGMLDSLLREECEDLCKEYGARVVKSVSKKVTHGIVGLEPGESKIAKLKANGTPTIDEDALFLMISSTFKEPLPSRAAPGAILAPTAQDAAQSVSRAKTSRPSSSRHTKAEGVGVKPNSDGLWVDKYKPTTTSELCANPKCIKDLKAWLSGWKAKFLYGDGHSLKLKDRKDLDFAAVLMSGAPGIGKTTAAHIVCKELGFEPHEFNASDCRNKGGVQALADSVMLANTMTKYFKLEPGASTAKGTSTSNGASRSKTTKPGPSLYPEGQVLIMDEVDGMSGGDRGGGQELIKMIKKSKVPIICIANDDSSPNMRSLAGNCVKLKFRRPMVSQVSKRLAHIAQREGFWDIDTQTLERLAEGCQGDIRQMINLLQTWRTSSASLTFGQVKDRLQTEGKTVTQRSVFDLSKSFFAPGPDGSSNSLAARTDNYFQDSDIVGLFVQENYVSTARAQSSLDALADAAESFSEGDLCNALIRKDQRWDLMPAAAIMGALRPGSIVSGALSGQLMFPSFLGNMSKGNKWKRIIQGLEMKVKAVKTSSGSARAFRLDYIPSLTTCLATPLIQHGTDGCEEVIDRLDAYYLQRDPDWVEILEAGVYAKGRAPMDAIKGPVKSALAREYNAGQHARSTVTGARIGVKGSGAAADVEKKMKRAAEAVGDVGVVDEDPESSEEETGASSDDEAAVTAQFGVRQRKRRASGGGSAAKKARGGRSGRGRGRGRK